MAAAPAQNKYQAQRALQRNGMVSGSTMVGVRALDRRFRGEALALSAAEPAPTPPRSVAPPLRPYRIVDAASAQASTRASPLAQRERVCGQLGLDPGYPVPSCSLAMPLRPHRVDTTSAQASIRVSALAPLGATAVKLPRSIAPMLCMCHMNADYRSGMHWLTGAHPRKFLSAQI